MIHFIQTKKLGKDKHAVLWQRGDYNYEIEILDFSVGNPYEQQIVTYKYPDTAFEIVYLIFQYEY